MSTLVAFVSNSFDATSAGNGNRCGRTRRPDIRPCLAAREDFRNWLIGEAPGSRNSSMRQDDSHCDGSLNGSANVLMPARSAAVCLSGTLNPPLIDGSTRWLPRRSRSDASEARRERPQHRRHRRDTTPATRLAHQCSR